MPRVIAGFVVALLVATGALALYGIGMTVAGRPLDRSTRLFVGAVVGAIAIQAVIAALQVLTRVSLPETSTFLIYLVVAICVLPIATQFAMAEPSRWGGLVVAVGAIATGVAILRLQGLWVPVG